MLKLLMRSYTVDKHIQSFTPHLNELSTESKLLCMPKANVMLINSSNFVKMYEVRKSTSWYFTQLEEKMLNIYICWYGKENQIFGLLPTVLFSGTGGMKTPLYFSKRRSLSQTKSLYLRITIFSGPSYSGKLVCGQMLKFIITLIHVRIVSYKLLQ